MHTYNLLKHYNHNNKFPQFHTIDKFCHGNYKLSYQTEINLATVIPREFKCVFAQNLITLTSVKCFRRIYTQVLKVIYPDGNCGRASARPPMVSVSLSSLPHSGKLTWFDNWTQGFGNFWNFCTQCGRKYTRCLSC